MDHNTIVARVLSEALPYFREFHGQTVVIKYGGHAMKDEALKQAFARNVVLLKYVGMHPVIVHGGGPQIGQMLKQLGIESTFQEGMRVTDQATMDVVEMVLVGRVNKEIVNLLNMAGGKAVGLSGKDGRLITARKLAMYKNRDTETPEPIDLGMVGQVESVNSTVIKALEKEDFIPVIAPVGVNDAGETFNINADYVASAVAGALKAKRFILLTDVAGVLDSQGNLIPMLNVANAHRLLEEGVISGGMIPKVHCCLEAVHSGAEKAFILDGRVENSVLLQLFTDQGIGTDIHFEPLE